MVWSAVTKTLVRQVRQSGKPVELPQFGIFGPIVDRFVAQKDPLEKGGARKGLEPGYIEEYRTIVAINQDFLDQSEAACDQLSDRAVVVFDS